MATRRTFYECECGENFSTRVEADRCQLTHPIVEYVGDVKVTIELWSAASPSVTIRCSDGTTAYRLEDARQLRDELNVGLKKAAEMLCAFAARKADKASKVGKK